MIIAAFIFFALTRAEIVERMRAPVLTQADGLVRVFADCPEDMRREYQGPIASYAAQVAHRLYAAAKMKERHFERPSIIVHIGDARTNIATVVTRLSTNDGAVVTRLYLKSPSGADLNAFEVELARAFYRAVHAREISPREARDILDAADPAKRNALSRARLEAFLRGDRAEQGATSDEDWDEAHLTLLRKVIEVGVATKRDVLTFASRLYLYPPHFSEPFEGGARSLSFREAIACAPRDRRIPLLAQRKAAEVALFGGGRSTELALAAFAYRRFLEDLAAREATAEDLEKKLNEADRLLQTAWEKAK